MVWLVEDYILAKQLRIIVRVIMYVDQSNLLDTCPQSTWQWQEGLNGGNLSIKYKTKKKASGHNYCTLATTITISLLI